jgi:hypothetical protein
LPLTTPQVAAAATFGVVASWEIFNDYVDLWFVASTTSRRNMAKNVSIEYAMCAHWLNHMRVLHDSSDLPEFDRGKHLNYVIVRIAQILASKYLIYLPV